MVVLKVVTNRKGRLSIPLLLALFAFSQVGVVHSTIADDGPKKNSNDTTESNPADRVPPPIIKPAPIVGAQTMGFTFTTPKGEEGQVTTVIMDGNPLMKDLNELERDLKKLNRNRKGNYPFVLIVPEMVPGSDQANKYMEEAEFIKKVLGERDLKVEIQGMPASMIKADEKLTKRIKSRIKNFKDHYYQKATKLDWTVGITTGVLSGVITTFAWMAGGIDPIRAAVIGLVQGHSTVVVAAHMPTMDRAYESPTRIDQLEGRMKAGEWRQYWRRTQWDLSWKSLYAIMSIAGRAYSIEGIVHGIAKIGIAQGTVAFSPKFNKLKRRLNHHDQMFATLNLNIAMGMLSGLVQSGFYFYWKHEFGSWFTLTDTHGIAFGMFGLMVATMRYTPQIHSWAAKIESGLARVGADYARMSYDFAKGVDHPVRIMNCKRVFGR